jgi:hypothetical protein
MALVAEIATPIAPSATLRQPHPSTLYGRIYNWLFEVPERPTGD